VQANWCGIFLGQPSQLTMFDSSTVRWDRHGDPCGLPAHRGPGVRWRHLRQRTARTRTRTV